MFHDVSSEDKEKRISLQFKLDDIFMKKAQGAFIRSRAKWMEGERNTTYFSKLKKKRQEDKAITGLLIEGRECKDSKMIEKEVYPF